MPRFDALLPCARCIRLRWIVSAIALALAGLAGAACVIGERLTGPSNAPVGAPPPELHAESVALPSATEPRIRGWFVAGAAGRGAVLLLHGVRSDRRQMLGRALALARAGHSVLLVDLPAHGESPGTRISFGHHEAEGVRISMRFLAQRLPAERRAVIGASLGAAAFVLAGVTPAPDAVVIEAMYPDIETAVRNRLRLHLGDAGDAIAPLLLALLPHQLGIGADRLRPIDSLAAIRAPLLIASGSRDRHTTEADTRRLFAAAQAPKSLWLAAGAGHVDLYRHDPAAYEAAVFPFLARHLGGAGH